MTWQLPFADKLITGHFGTLSEYRKKMGMQPHSGTDWAPKGNTLIPAIASGTVRLIQWSNVLGWVMVQTAMDKNKQLWYIGYCHLSCTTHGVDCKGPAVKCTTPFKSLKVGDRLAAGQTAGRVGNTGSASTGPHLHATASKDLKGVFGPTSVKVDLHKLIKENM
jgi:murein DD-endopeptidase MepM/ murein hydrolase activator NlpD